jgi:hypothetical protein
MNCWKTSPSRVLNTHDIIRRIWRKIMYLELRFFWKKKINEAFSVIYQKREFGKLNKTTYLYVNFQWAKPVLLAEYHLRVLIFRPTSGSIFTPFPLAFSHFSRAQTEFWICCTIFYPLQNGKKIFKKNGMFMSKLISHYSEMERFLMVLSKNRIFIEAFITRIQLYIKLNVIFRINAKTALNHMLFSKKKFLSKTDLWSSTAVYVKKFAPWSSRGQFSTENFF